MPSTVTPERVETVICDALATFGTERSEIHRDARLTDLDIDSLDLAELSQILDEEFGVRLSSADAKQIVTVGEAIDIVAGRA